VAMIAEDTCLLWMICYVLCTSLVLTHCWSPFNKFHLQHRGSSHSDYNILVDHRNWADSFHEHKRPPLTSSLNTFYLFSSENPHFSKEALS
jgi:hypothetical protein